MKNLISGLFVAFSLYSKIPVPRTEWTKDTMKYALPFLPLVGVVVGALELLWLYLAQSWGLEGLLYAVVAVLLPVAVTGGIHLDGFTDTTDALCSYGDQRKRLEILKDPHVGAFGVMYVAGLLLLQAGLYTQIFSAPALAPVLVVSYTFARTIGGSAIVWLPCAKDSGLARTFADGSDKMPVRIALAIEMALCLVLMLDFNPAAALAIALACAVLLPVYRHFCMKAFGGLTGDLAGFAITLSETIILLICVVGGVIVRG